MNVINTMEPIIQSLFTEYIKQSPLACNCERCQVDVKVIALNRLPARYVSSLRGEVFMKTQLLNPQLRSDVMRELAHAAEIVANNPHH